MNKYTNKTLYRLIPIKETVLKFFSQEWFFSLSQFGTAERESFESDRDRGARIIWVSSGPRITNHLSQIGTAERESRIIWVSSGPRITNHLSQIGTTERESRIIWVSSGPRITNHLSQFGTANHESFESVRDHGARITNHLSQFGTANHESFESDRDRESRIIWVSSGPRSANHESFESVRDHGARITNHLSQFGTANRESFESDRDHAARIVNHLSQFGTANRESFESDRDHAARIVNHLSQFGTAERESFESDRDRESRIIWVRSGPRIANHLNQIGTANRESFESDRDRGARIIWVVHQLWSSASAANMRCERGNGASRFFFSNWDGALRKEHTLPSLVHATVSLITPSPLSVSVESLWTGWWMRARRRRLERSWPCSCLSVWLSERLCRFCFERSSEVSVLGTEMRPSSEGHFSIKPWPGAERTQIHWCTAPNVKDLKPISCSKVWGQ